MNIAGEDLIQRSTLFVNLSDEGAIPGFATNLNLIWSPYLRARPLTSPWRGHFHFRQLHFYVTFLTKRRPFTILFCYNLAQKQ